MLEKFRLLEETNCCGSLISEHEKNMEIHYDVIKQKKALSIDVSARKW
jgi:hypothetical protein